MENEKKFTGPAYEFEAKMPLKQAIPLGLQHVLAMFVGNLTPLLIITGACGITGGNDLAQLQIELLQNAMLVAGLITLLQLFSVGPVGGKVRLSWEPALVSSVYNSVAATMGGGILAYGAIMGASIIGGLFESVLGCFLKPLRRFFPSGRNRYGRSFDWSVIDRGRRQFLRRPQLGAGLWFHGKYAACYFCPDCDSGSEARNEGIFKFFLDSGRNYCRLCCSIHHGSGASAHRALQRTEPNIPKHGY